MMTYPLYPRFVEPGVVEALEDTPVVLVHGPRQCGKTTLTQIVGKARGYRYFSFDDEAILAAATSDPIGFVADLPERSILDEIQRAPGLFSSLKTVIDRDRIPGRFLLTGSSNVLLLPALSDSLAGRMEIIRLHPLAQCEIEGRRSNFVNRLFDGSFGVEKYDRLGPELADRISSGGYPAALARQSDRRRLAWYRNYIETLVQRDVRDLARISSLDVLPRLLSLAADQTARLINISDLAGPFQLSRPTIREYVTLLERVFLLEELSPWHSNRLKRLVRTPKLHVGDTGVVSALLGVDAKALSNDRPLLGQMLETFVFQELRRSASWQERDIRFHHFRDRDGVEVDIVLERSDNRLAGVEVKASSTVRTSDFRGLRKLREATRKRFANGVVLYDGDVSAGFGDGMYAVPIRSLWEEA